MEVREVQFLKQLSPKFVTEEGMFMDVREVQSLKQLAPKRVTEEGMSMWVRDVQPMKHPSKLVTEDEIFTVERAVQ